MLHNKFFINDPLSNKILFKSLSAAIIFAYCVYNEMYKHCIE